MEAIACSRPLPRMLNPRLSLQPTSLTRSYTKETLNYRHRKARRAQLADKDVLATDLPVTVISGPKKHTARKPILYGKPRDMSSDAAKAERLRDSLRVEKALLQERLGENVYAYRNIRTGQVVYSLTKVMNVRPPPPLSNPN